MTSLRWEDLNLARRTIKVRDRKNPYGSAGNNDEIPLLGNSIKILLMQPKVSELIFPHNSRSITAGFRRTCKQLGIKGLRYHDLRREGCRLADSQKGKLLVHVDDLTELVERQRERARKEIQKHIDEFKDASKGNS